MRGRSGRRTSFAHIGQVIKLEQKIRLEEIKTGSCQSEGDWKGNVILCPGGGYQWLSPREELPVADAFIKQGWRTWILYYTVSEHGETLDTLPLREAAEAVRRVRQAYPGEMVVACGFSAGGHVAASLGVHWNDTCLFSEEEIAFNRPDALVLCYPVITAGKYAHQESIRMLAGEENAEYFNLESYVDAETPPTFLWHTASDQTVPVQNSLLFAGKLAEYQIPFETHIYPYGVHGLSLATKETEEPDKERYADSHVAGWFRQCTEWLELIRQQ